MVSECVVCIFVFLLGLCGVLFVSLLLHTLCAMCYECAHAWYSVCSVLCVCVLYVVRVCVVRVCVCTCVGQSLAYLHVVPDGNSK